MSQAGIECDKGDLVPSPSLMSRFREYRHRVAILNMSLEHLARANEETAHTTESLKAVPASRGG